MDDGQRDSDARRARPVAPADTVLLAAAVLAAALALRRRRRSRSGAAAVVPGDLRPHDGISGGEAQLVFFEGGPLDGSRLPLPWSARSYEMALDDRSRHRYVDSGRTAPSPTGSPGRVFVAQGVTTG